MPSSPPLPGGMSPISAFGTEHPFAGDAGNFARADGHPFGRQVGAEGRQDDEPARSGHVGRAADHPLLVSFAAVDGDELEPRTARVRLDLANGRDDDGLEARAVGVQPFDFEPGAREPIGDLRRGCREPRNERA